MVEVGVGMYESLLMELSGKFTSEKQKGNEIGNFRYAT
jgi:hypothetical protein